MTQPYVGEIRMFAGNFPPVGWEFCDGGLYPISEYDVVFTLIGTTYGGDGQSTFALPDLRGRVPIHMGTATSGTSYVIGQSGGVESVTLTTQQIPAHTHQFLADNDDGNVITPAGTLPARSNNVKVYTNSPTDGAFAANAISPAGASQPHDNMQPYLGVNYIFSMYGEFPSQT